MEKKRKKRNNLKENVGRKKVNKKRKKVCKQRKRKRKEKKRQFAVKREVAKIMKNRQGSKQRKGVKRRVTDRQR